jgi:hypothetical protein
MTFKDVDKFSSTDYDVDYNQLEQIVKNVQMNGITSLYLSAPSPIWTGNLHLPCILPNILPNLHEVDLCNSDVTNGRVLSLFSENCPLLEKLTHHKGNFALSGWWMRFSNSLKEINMDNATFNVYEYNKIWDLNNHQEMFMFHCCCNALERVSIRNPKYLYSLNFYEIFVVNEQDFTQKILIKFVRNAPPTLRWLRSDLTTDNMTMLRVERPGIELSN